MPTARALQTLDRPHLLLTLTALIWAGNAVAGRFADGHVSPMWLTFGRWAIAVAIVGALAHREIRRDWPVIRRHVPYLFAMGATGYTAFNYFLYSALTHTTAITVAIWQSAMPLFIFALGYLAFRTPTRWGQAAGFALTAAGVATVAAKGDVSALFAGRVGANWGDVLMVGAVVSYAAYSVALKAKPAMGALSFLFCMMAAALVVAAGGLAVEGWRGAARFPADAQGWAVVIYAGIFPSIIAQAFFIRGVEGIGANAAGLFINLVPVLTAGLAIALLGETLHLYHAAAFVLVVGGVLLAGRGSGPKRQRSAAR